MPQKNGETVSWIPGCRAEVLDNQTIYLASESKKAILKGKAFSQIAPLLSKQHYSDDEIVEVLTGRVAPELVYYALNELEKKNWLFRSRKLLPDSIAAYCQLLDVSEEEANKQLYLTKLYIEGPIGLKLCLQKAHIQVVEEREESNLEIRCVKDYLDPLENIPDKKPWLLCKPFGSQIWLGPIFDREEGGCYDCLMKRMHINRPEEVYFEAKRKQKALFPSHNASLPSTEHFAWNWITTELFKFIVLQKNSQLEGKIQTFDTLSGDKEEHLLIQRPTCRFCGEGSAVSTASFSLTSREVKGVDGGLRTTPPEETVRKYAPYISPILGVVNKLERAPTEEGSAIHVYNSGMNFAVPKIFKQASLSSFRNSCAGKGATEAQAKASAICEALERNSGIYHGDEEKREATFEELGEEAVHPHSCTLYSQAQYQERKKKNAESHSFWKIPPPFPERERMPWTPLFSLTENRVKYLPTSCCYYNMFYEGWDGGGDSNGCAAGNCLEEAILQGFFELVERDSIAIWWYNQLQLPRVDLTSFHDLYVNEMLKEYEKRDREVWALDLTMDLEIPTFALLSRLVGHPHEQVIFGFGTHLNAKIALLRALSEMNQFIQVDPFWNKECFGDGKREKVDKRIVREWMEEVRIEEQPYLKGSSKLNKASDYKPWESRDILEDVHTCRSIVEREGIEMLVLNQTRPEIRLPVVRVVVPGLRHFWPRFAPGRLYDVPVKMGWLKEPLQESQLNSRGVWF